MKCERVLYPVSELTVTINSSVIVQIAGCNLVASYTKYIVQLFYSILILSANMFN